MHGQLSLTRGECYSPWPEAGTNKITPILLCEHEVGGLSISENKWNQFEEE
jgi:hypothetical protein